MRSMPDWPASIEWSGLNVSYGQPMAYRDDVFGCWRTFSEGAVRLESVIAATPRFDENLGLTQRVKPSGFTALGWKLRLMVRISQSFHQTG